MTNKKNYICDLIIELREVDRFFDTTIMTDVDIIEVNLSFLNSFPRKVCKKINISVISNILVRERDVFLYKFHINSEVEPSLKNHLGPSVLRFLLDRIMEEFSLDSIEIIGASRTSGANPGRYPERIRFTRRPSS